MAEKFYTILTNVGKSKIAEATASETKLNLVTLKIGDSNGTYYEPTEVQTDLIHTVWSGSINDISIDKDNKNRIVISSPIPSDVGNFTIREVGVFDDSGDMIAIGKYPETYKPTSNDGSIKDVVLRMILEISNTATIEMQLDPNVVSATKQDINGLKSEFDSQITEDTYITKTLSKDNTYIDSNVEKDSLAKISVKGRTRVDLLPPIINNIDSQVTLTRDRNIIKMILNEDGEYGARYQYDPTNLIDIDVNKYYIFSAYIRNVDSSDGGMLKVSDNSSKVLNSSYVVNSDKFTRVYLKFAGSYFLDSPSIYPCIKIKGLSGQSILFMGCVLEEITQEEYNLVDIDIENIVGNSLSLGEIPVIIKSTGKNLFNKDTVTFGTVYYNNDFLQYSFLNARLKSNIISVKSLTIYTLSSKSNINFSVLEYDKNLALIKQNDWQYDISNYSFTSGKYTKYILIVFMIDNTENTIIDSIDSVNLSTLQLEEGSAPTEYESYKEASIIVDEPLRSIDNTVYDEIKNNKKYSRVEELDLTGGLYWIGIGRNPGYHHVSLSDDTNNIDINNILLLKFNNKKVPFADDALGGSSYSCYRFITNRLHINIPNSDSGWGDNYDPTSDEIKAYFYGWRMMTNGGEFDSTYNGTGSKAWFPLVYKNTDYGKELGWQYLTSCPDFQFQYHNPYRLFYQKIQPEVISFDLPDLILYPNGHVFVDNSNLGVVPEVNLEVATNLNSNLEIVKDTFKTNRILDVIKPYIIIPTIKDMNLYVDENNGDDLNGDGSAIYPYKSIQRTINSLSKCIQHNVYIHIAPGTYDEQVLIEGFFGGGYIQLIGNPSNNLPYIVSNIRIIYNNLYIRISGVYIQNTLINNVLGTYSGFGIGISSCHVCYLEHITFSDAPTKRALYLWKSNAYMATAVINNNGVAFTATVGSTLELVGCSGSGNSVVYNSDASIIYCGSNAITGTTQSSKANGGQIFS